MRPYGCAVLLGCLALGCSGEPARSSYDASKSPRTGAYQQPEEEGMQPASRVRADEDVVIVERVEEVETAQPRDPLADPVEQGTGVEDQRTTQQIRSALQDDDLLSDAAKNVKVITLNRRVTLRGPVESTSESQRVEAHAKQVAGPENVDNQLEIKRPQ